MQTQHEHIREGSFYFPKYDISIPKGSLNTIGKLEPFGKITLFTFSQC